MDLVAVVLSSTLVSAIVGSAAGYLSQRSLAKRQALLDYEYNAKKRLYEVIGSLRFQLLPRRRQAGVWAHAIPKLEHGP